MSQANQALWFNAVPLLFVAAAYLGATALLGPSLWDARRRASLLDLAIFLVFPAFGLVAGVYGVVILVDREPLAGGVWLTLAVALMSALPPLLVLTRWRERAILATGALRAREAEARSSSQDRETRSMAAMTSALGRSDDAGAVAVALLEQVEEIAGVELACLMLVDDQARTASGLIGRVEQRELEWFPDVRIDLDNEPSGVATAALEAAPFAVYDARASKIVSSRMVEATGARSVAFVPLLANQRVIAVLVVGTVSKARAFESDELAHLQTLAAETALALDRTRSTVALEEALERERFVARISARVRSELDVDELLRVAVKQTGTALGADRSLIRLGGVNDEVTAQWHVPQLQPVGAGDRLAVSNLAVRSRRTVAVSDMENAQELDDDVLGGRDALRALGSRAVLAVPIIVFDELLGVLALHRASTGPWSPSEITLTEAVAREIGLAVRVASLLRENERRIAQQSAFFHIAELLGESLSLSATVKALAQAASEALGGTFAAVLMPHGTRLELVAGAALPGALAAALEDGVPESAECLRSATEEGRILASPDVLRDDRFERRWHDVARAADYGALLAVPVESTRAERFGLLIVFFASERVFVGRRPGARAPPRRSGARSPRAQRVVRGRAHRPCARRSSWRAPAEPARDGARSGRGRSKRWSIRRPRCSAPTRAPMRDPRGGRARGERRLRATAPRRRSARAPRDGVAVRRRRSSRGSPVAIEDVVGGRHGCSDADPSWPRATRPFSASRSSGPKAHPQACSPSTRAGQRTWRQEEIEALVALGREHLGGARERRAVPARRDREGAQRGDPRQHRRRHRRRRPRRRRSSSGTPRRSRSPACRRRRRSAGPRSRVLQRKLESRTKRPVRASGSCRSMRGGEEVVALADARRSCAIRLGAVAGRIFAFRDISADRIVEQDEVRLRRRPSRTSCARR